MNYTVNSTDISNGIKIAYFGILLSEFCVGIFGNILILIVFRKMGPRSNIDWYIIIIAIIDIIVLFTNVPLYFIQKTDLWLTFGSDLVCKLSYFVTQVLTIEVSILICIIAMERVYAVYKPSEIYIPRQRVKYVILVSSSAVFLASTPMLIIKWSVSERSCSIVSPLIFGLVFYAIIILFYLAITVFASVSYMRIALGIYRAGKRVAANKLKSKMVNCTTTDEGISNFHQQNEVRATVAVGRRNAVHDNVESALLVRIGHIYSVKKKPHMDMLHEGIQLKEAPEIITKDAKITDAEGIKHSIKRRFCPYISDSKTHPVQNKNIKECKIQYPTGNFAPNKDSRVTVNGIKAIAKNEYVGLDNISIYVDSVTEMSLPGKVEEPPLRPSESNREFPRLLETAFTIDIPQRGPNKDGEDTPDNNGRQQRSTGSGRSNKDDIILDRKHNPEEPTALSSKSRDQKANLFSSLNFRARESAINTTKLVFLVTIIYLGSWIPVWSAFILSFAFPGRFLIITMFLKPCYLINCSVNSFLCIGFNTRFRKTLYRLICGRE